MAELTKKDFWLNNAGEIITKDNIDSFIPEISDKRADKLAKSIVRISKGKGSWDQFYEKNFKNENEKEYIKNFINQTKDLSKVTGEDLVKANQNARQSILDQNEALQKSSISSRAASFGMEALKGVLTTAAFTAIATAVSAMANAIITKITEIVNAYEDGIKKIKDLSNEVKSLENEQSSLNDELRTSKERLYELQQIKMPTLFEKSEIENLKEYNKQLETQIKLKEIEIKQKNKEVNEAAQKLYKGSQTDYNGLDDFFTEDFEWWEHILNFTSHGKYQLGKNTFQNVTNWVQGNTQEQQDTYVKEAAIALDNYNKALEKTNKLSEEFSNQDDIVKKVKEIKTLVESGQYDNLSTGYIAESVFGDSLENAAKNYGQSVVEFKSMIERAIEEDNPEDYIIQFVTDNVNDELKESEEIWNNYLSNLQTRLSEAQIQRLSLDSDDPKNAETIKNLDNLIAQIERVIYSKTRYKNFTDIYNSVDFSDTVTQLNDLAKKGKLTEDTFNNVKGIERFKEALAEVGETDISYIIYSIIDQVQKSDSAFDNAAESAKNYADSISKIKEVLNNSDLFNSAIEKQKNGESLNYDEVMGLVELDPSLASSFIKTADGYSVAIQTLIDADKKYVRENGIQEIEENLNQVTTNVANAKSKIVQLNNRKAEIQAIILANKGNDHFNANGYNEELSKINDEINTLTDSVKEGEEAVAVYNLALAELGDNVADKISKSYVSIVSGVEAVTSKLEILGKVYKDVQDGEDFDWSSILNNDEFKSTFASCTETYSAFIETITKSPDDIEACQEAFNKLVGEYVYGSGVLNDLTEDTREAAVAMLEQNGIVNAAEIVDAKLKQLAITREHEAEMTELQSKRSLEAKESYLSEIQMSQITAQALLQTVYEKIRFNKTEVKTVNDVDNLIALAKTAKATAGTLDYLNKMRDLTADGGFNQTLYDEGKRIANSSNGIRINSGYEAQAYEYYKKYSSYLRQLKEGFDLEFEIPEFKFDGTIFDTSKDSNSSKSNSESKKTFD